MRKTILAGLLLASGASAGGVTYFGEISGKVDSRSATVFTSADARSDIDIGDIITARFSYVVSEGFGGPVGAAAAGFLASELTDQISFELAGYRWTSAGDFLDGMVPLSFGPAEDPLRGFALTTDDAPGAGDLQVTGYDFEIGEFGYGLYEGFGYTGAFDRSTLRVWTNERGLAVGSGPVTVTAVPEPLTWSLMIAGFVMIGAAARRRPRSGLAETAPASLC